jgi:uncharacterized membrane protein
MIIITIIMGLLLLLLFAFASASIAKSKNRDQMFWFFCGLLFGLIGLIVVALLPKLEIRSLSPSSSTKFIAQTGIIAALYAAITIILAPISYGPIQVRLSEALTVLPYITPAAIPGLFIGCLVANIYGGLGLVDIFGGSLCTLIAAMFTYLLSKSKKPILAPLPPVVVNALGVSFYLHILFKYPYWLTVLYIAVGEFFACFVLGYALLQLLLKRGKFLK